MPNGNNNSTPNTTGGIGYLDVSVFYTNIGGPAQGALVQILDPQQNIVLEELTTDETGRIPTVTLATPPLDYSMSYDRPRPFNQYNVQVTLPGYTEANIENVQIYPDSLAIQNAFLRPSFENIFIQYPTLWGDFPPKIPEEPIKPMPIPSGLVVLPKPVVPDTIVVHAGRPSDTSATNHVVSFTDYLKNVLSSEIYSTWPREALKANALAVNSFTLNRVYTEWYRGKGYNFTITNSTAYDQAFNYGRNLFQEMASVVDEIFTTYITKPNITQPLFTQYSDGRRIVREGWLSQWGSKELADQGYTALEILKYYYGSDIILRQAEKVQGVPLSFPGTPLVIGSTGQSVRTIQEQLNAISNNYPLIPKNIVDGVYGERTAEAVRVFQRVFKLPVTGEVNFPTWYKISDVYVAVRKLA